ncbi:MAG TPA: YajQ family cyclic di-GMP-binding protein [Gemmatimonadetes bacterium]|jgi:uncharacterized protein YajQ (UPF0234 family)|nr:YajQ family cyclic di-GMP-binding protein [Gemmatimonadota bacterium]
MASKNSFDVSTGVDLQEVDNAVNQATKEILTRYDFKGTDCSIHFDRDAAFLQLEADDEYRMTQVIQILREKLSRRKVPLKNLDPKSIETGSLGRAKQTIYLKQGIDQEIAKKMVKAVKDCGFKKVQVQIQGDQLRVISPSRDDLQNVQAFLRGEDWGLELHFGNYR